MDPDRARALLRERRTELQDVARVATQQGSLDESQTSSAGEMPMDQHGDAASDTLEREVDLSVRGSAEASIEEVDRALERLDAGTYGICSVCEQPIDDERLEVRPEAQFCAEHQPAVPAPEDAA